MQSDTGQTIWRTFCGSLADLGDTIANVEGLTELDRAEGYRYLTRLTRLALEMQLEHNSSAHPSFYSLSHDTAKIGADNPDNLYLNARIDGAYDYEISGQVGTAPYLSFGSKENRYAIDGRMISTGEVELAQLDVGADGQLSLILSQQQQPTNWLPITERSNMVIVRQTFNDRSSEIPARLSIKRCQAEATYDRLSLAGLDTSLTGGLAFVRGTMDTFLAWVEMFKAANFNQFQLGDQSFFQAAGGDPNICYIYAFWHLAEDEALVVSSDIPPCDYWNFQLTNMWMESLDYRHHAVHLNGHTAEVEPGGGVTIYITHQPAQNLPNNLLTTGHTQGVMLMRWVGANSHPIPTLRIVKTASLQT